MKTMIIVADGLEECEALMTYDLLYRAGIKVDLVGSTKQIRSSHNVIFETHRLLDEIDPEEYECLVLPGGMPGTLNLEKDQRVQELRHTWRLQMKSKLAKNDGRWQFVESKASTY